MLSSIDFLRLSRATVDDSITQNLNALLTPASDGFDPSSTSQRGIRQAAKRGIDPQSCREFKEGVLFDSWQSRSDVFNYCRGVAASQDPGDPDSVLRQAELERDRERLVDERLDPYSARFFPQEARTEALANLLKNETMVERIVRSRTWGLVSERCGDNGLGWEQALNRWRADRMDRSQNRIKRVLT